MTSESFDTSRDDAAQSTSHVNGSGGAPYTNGGTPPSAFAIAAPDLLASGTESHDLDVYERCEALAKQAATALNHGEWTFAHLLLAMTQVSEAREKLQEYKYMDAVGSQKSFNVAGARQAAFAALAVMDQGLPALMDESGELKTILSCARLKARKRERVYQTKQPIAVKDILDAVIEQGGEAPAFRMLNSPQPLSPLLEIKESLIYLKGAFGSQATWNLGLVQRIALMDEQLHGRLNAIDTTVKGQPQFIIDAVRPGRRPLLVASGIAGALALGLLGGFVLASSGMSTKIFAWLGQWIV